MTQIQNIRPIFMEDYFSPGFITKPAVHIGSQSMRLYHGDESEQAIEGLHMAGASKEDVVVVRNIDSAYIQYWQQLVGNPQVINILTENKRDYLSTIILNSPDIIDSIKQKMAPNATMMVYFPTDLEMQVAESLGIKLHGSSSISSQYGTKTGIRKLANEALIHMPEGFICESIESIKEAIQLLFQKFDHIIIKHDLSSAGRWMKKLKKEDEFELFDLINEICGGEFLEGRDKLVVEGWVENKASLCVHIEILENRDPILAAAWQQVFDEDGVSYMGAGPLRLSQKAIKSLKEEATKLALALKKEGAIGSYGPDFIIASDDDPNYEKDQALLIELNARVPFTAFPIEIIKQIKGKIGTGFFTQNIKMPVALSFNELSERLKKEQLLIKKPDADACGVVPYNIGLLNWRRFYYVAMAKTWEEAKHISDKVNAIFQKK